MLSDQSCVVEAFHFSAHREKISQNTICYSTFKIYSQATKYSDLGSNANTYNETDY